MRPGPSAALLASALALAATATAGPPALAQDQGTFPSTFNPVLPRTGTRDGTTAPGLRPSTGTGPSSAPRPSDRDDRSPAALGSAAATAPGLAPAGGVLGSGGAQGSSAGAVAPGGLVPGGAASSTDSRSTGARGRADRRLPATKRTRSPVAATVRPPVRAVLAPPRLRNEGRVHVPVLGLPDPPPPPLPPAAPPVPGAPVVPVPTTVAPADGSGPPPELRRRRIVEDDPYAPLGIKQGRMIYYPAIGQGVGYDSNPSRTQPKERGSAFLRTDGELRFQSDWSVHELSGELRGGYSAYPSARGADRPDGDGAVRLRLDANRDTQIDFEGRYKIDTQRPGSPDLSVATLERPTVATFGGSAGVTEHFNRFSIGLRGNVDREVYENARLAGGTILRQDDRDTTQYGLRLRAAYDVTPGLTPFVDTLLDTRVHDLPIDFSGYRRDSDGIGIKAGTSFEISRILTGEISAGVQRRAYEDRRLRDLRGPLVDASIAWLASPLTTVRLRAGTSVSETSIQGASGILTTSGTVEVQHDLRRNLRLILSGTALTNDYQGVRIHEDGLSGSVKLDYRLTRWLSVRASYAHDRLHSNVAGGSYTANTYLVGLRWNP